MKIINTWAKGIAGFVLGVIVASVIFLAWPHSRASQPDIYDRVSALEKEVEGIKKGLESDAKARAAKEASERRWLNSR